MVRVINFFCFAVSAFACLALYHVSEQTRVVRAELRVVEHGITQERQVSDTLQAEWGRVAEPSRLQRLAEAQGVEDRPSVELASTALLPRRGDNLVPDAELRSASAIVATPAEAGLMVGSPESGR
ncbi:MAG: hypothetical protein ACJ8EL_02280 [Rhizomicrobium sp.]|jgi:hypothetical protein